MKDRLPVAATMSALSAEAAINQLLANPEAILSANWDLPLVPCMRETLHRISVPTQVILQALL